MANMHAIKILEDQISDHSRLSLVTFGSTIMALTLIYMNN